MNRQFDESKLVNDELCKKCGGRCCKQCGCLYFPEDFKFELTFDNLKSEIDKGFIAIDAISYADSIYNKLDNPVYYLRVRNINDFTPVGINGFGTCKLLIDDHCWFEIKDRPSGGKYYIPFSRGCYTLYTNQDLIDLWSPYQKEIMLLIEHYKK